MNSRAETQPLKSEVVDGAVMLVHLNAPERHNSLTPEMLCRLADAYARYAEDASLRVLVITGTGPKAFCAGADLERTIPLLTGERPPSDAWDQRLLDDPQVLRSIGQREQHLQKPVISAINGLCVAGGFELMLSTDLRVIAEHAIFALPEVQRAIIPFGGSLVRLPRQVPHALAMELLLTGEPIHADTALRIGLVNRAVPLEALLPTAMQLARRIAANGPLAIQAIKSVVQSSAGLSAEDGFSLEDQAWERVRQTRDAREGPLAFMQKRLPTYRCE